MQVDYDIFIPNTLFSVISSFSFVNKNFVLLIDVIQKIPNYLCM